MDRPNEEWYRNERGKLGRNTRKKDEYKELYFGTDCNRVK